MNNYEIEEQVDNQTVQLTYARAVLNEATHYFDGKDKWPLLPLFADHILILLYVVAELLQRMEPELEKAVNELHEKAKQEE
jgi:hypothetical protein